LLYCGIEVIVHFKHIYNKLHLILFYLIMAYSSCKLFQLWFTLVTIVTVWYVLQESAFHPPAMFLKLYICPLILWWKCHTRTVTCWCCGDNS